MRQLLAAADGFRSAQELYALLRSADASVGLSTVYRHLQNLVDSGEVDVLHDPVGQSTYRYCGAARTGHEHYHLICRACGRAEEIDGTVPDQWADAMARGHHYIDVDLTVAIFGLCPRCSS